MKTSFNYLKQGLFGQAKHSSRKSVNGIAERNKRKTTFLNHIYIFLSAISFLLLTNQNVYTRNTNNSILGYILLQYQNHYSMKKHTNKQIQITKTEKRKLNKQKNVYEKRKN